MASALNALYQAGGPSPTGSFRDVRIMRQGRVAERVDLYAYLLQGDNLSDSRLEPGDVIFVPPIANAQVSVEGEVANPAIYELLPSETLLDLLAFAGGLNAPAHLRHARITRILPPEERFQAGVDRTVIDVDLADAVRDPARAPRLRSGDAVRIFPVRGEVRNTVSVTGGVWRPGTFRYEPGMRAWDAITRAEGLSDEAYQDRGHIVRVDPRDSTLRLIPFSLQRNADGGPAENPELREFDTIRVFTEPRFTTEFPVTISGQVREPLTIPYHEGLTLRDLILQAGGLQHTADLTVEIARLADPERRDVNQIAEIHQVRIDSTYLVSEQDRRHYLGGRMNDLPSHAEFLLEPYDRVTIKPLPELEFQRHVTVRGEVRQPGSYALRTRDERVLNIIERAGGLRETAYPGGFQLYRDGTLVSVELERALRNPASPQNVVLMPGDELVVPEYNPVVVVRGAVNAAGEVAVLYRERAPLSYYINQAGGYARQADRRNVHLRHANGEGESVARTLGVRREPRPRPGSVVTVPLLRDEDRFDTVGLIRDLAQVAGALTTILLLVRQVR